MRRLREQQCGRSGKRGWSRSFSNCFRIAGARKHRRHVHRAWRRAARSVVLCPSSTGPMFTSRTGLASLSFRRIKRTARGARGPGKVGGKIRGIFMIRFYAVRRLPRWPNSTGLLPDDRRWLGEMRREGKKVKGDTPTAWIIRSTCDAFGTGESQRDR